jgi:hypothetical protein
MSDLLQTGPPVQMPTWMVGRRNPDANLGQLIEQFEADPNAQVVRLLHPVDDPRALAIVAMTEVSMEGYRQEFGEEFVFEPNALVTPMDGGS